MDHRAMPAPGALRGVLRVPSDKSVSHRAVLFAAMAEGTSLLADVLDSADVRSTLEAVRALGAKVDVGKSRHGLAVTLKGWGARGPHAPDAAIDCGNSGTTARLLMGVLAGWPIEVTLTGDDSLSRRPMRRVTGPLAAMGAAFETSGGGTLPVTLRGTSELAAADYDSPVASAQVKTAVLLGGLRAHGRTAVTEPAPSRDHTERLLPAFGVPVGRDGLTAWVDGPAALVAADVSVPADPSSAAFMAGAALMKPGGDVALRGVSVNPTRTGFLRVLERMGARVGVGASRSEGAEPVADVDVAWAGQLQGTTITAEEVPSLVDEVPLLAVVATQAFGTTRFEGVGELRVKESDRLAAVDAALRALGVVARSGDDWLEVEGPARLHGGAMLDSLGDHRLAMAYAVAALAADAPVFVTDFDAVAVSYPRFEHDLSTLLKG